ncbi:MAG: LLM class flavin-dependent oxidoreductase [Actinobacteria bacterium]|nr:LLM class flavin-dependent oxidoreductase [Actinomycetota bacterium]
MSEEKRIEFGLRHPPCRPVDEVASFAQRAEDAGFDMAWFPDSQFLWRDVWMTMAIAARSTSRIGLGTALTNFETRSVATTAAAISTFEEFAPHRLRVGIGTGDSAVKTLGLNPTKLTRMREEMDRLRKLVRGEPVTFGGTSGPYANRLMRVKVAPGYEVPLYMGATGPKALTLAGAIADGVIILSGASPELIERSIGHVRRGAEEAGRDFGELDIVLAAHTAITRDEAEAAQLVKPMVVASTQLGAGAALREIGIEIEVPPVADGVYPDMTHAEDWDLAVERAQEWVNDDLGHRYATRYALAGTAESVADRVETAVSLGITGFYILGLSSYELPESVLEAFGSEVIPRVRGGAAG